MSTLNIYLLGSPRLDLDGQTVTLERNKALALLAYLAMEQTDQAREILATLFWPEYDRERAYAYLRRTLWEINERLGEGWLDAGREQVSLRRGSELRVDVALFHDALEECTQHGHPAAEVCGRCIQPLEQAVTFYRGDFMTGFSLRDSAAFDEWQLFQSEKLKTELAGALQRLALAYADRADYTRAIQSARRWLSLDLLNEEAHRLLMQVYASAGQRNAALRQYQECQRILDGELGVEPQAETARLYETIKTGELARQEIPQMDIKPTAINVQLVNLPSPATPFVGRVKELAEIDTLLQNPECRLLTLIGPGGIGKTRLSIQAAARFGSQLGTQFADGVVFVSLAPVNSPEWLVSAIASSLKLQFRSEQMRRDTPESQKVQLIEYLRDRRILLVLDNFEQIISGADLLSELLTNSPKAKLLVTSRERLHLAEEWVLEVGGMTFPQDGSLEPLEAYSAVQLFMQNARRTLPNFQIGEAEKSAVAHICRMVEGVPLAIELAAAWVKLLSPAEIAGEIERNLDFLTTDLRGLPERHQSLRAVFEHSWSLLSSREQDALMRLSVLRSPFRRETGEAVVSGVLPNDPEAMAASGRSNMPFLMLLSALVDKSLLRRVQSNGQEVRFGMHELIRQYALEKLQATPGAVEQTGSLHSRYYAAWIEKMLLEMHSSRQIQALDQVETEIEDVRAAWYWMVEHGDLISLQRAMMGLYHFYNIRNRMQDAEEDFRLALESVSTQYNGGDFDEKVALQTATAQAYLAAIYSSVLFNIESDTNADEIYQRSLRLAARLQASDQAQVYSLLGFGIGRIPPKQVKQLYQKSLDYFQQSGNRWSEAMAMLIYVTFTEYSLVDMELSRQLCEDSLRIFKQLGDRVGMVFSLNNEAGLCYSLGEYEKTKQLSLESAELCRILGDRWRMATALLNAGQACVAMGEYNEAKKVYQESLKLVRELGNRRVVARFLSCLGYVHFLEQEYKPAENLFIEALEYSRQIGDQREMGMSHMNLGNIAVASGDLAAARPRYQAAIEALENINYAQWEYSISLKRMANLCYQLGEVEPAWGYFRQALQISIGLKRTPEILDNLVGIAELLSSQGQSAQAVEILSFSLKHEEMALDVRQRGQDLLARLQSNLMEADYSTANQAGLAASLDNILNSNIL